MKRLLVSDITDTIYLANAKPVKGHTDLFETIGEKQDYTNECLKAVYQWFLQHCKEGESGVYRIRFAGKPWLTMNLNEKNNEHTK